MGFFLAPFAGGALVAALVAAAGAGTAITLLVFLARLGASLLAALRPIARSHRRMPARCAPARRRWSAAPRW